MVYLSPWFAEKWKKHFLIEENKLLIGNGKTHLVIMQGIPLNSANAKWSKLLDTFCNVIIFLPILKWAGSFMFHVDSIESWKVWHIGVGERIHCIQILTRHAVRPHLFPEIFIESHSMSKYLLQYLLLVVFDCVQIPYAIWRRWKAPM